jgi:hypothetical protein
MNHDRFKIGCLTGTVRPCELGGRNEHSIQNNILGILGQEHKTPFIAYYTVNTVSRHTEKSRNRNPLVRICKSGSGFKTSRIRNTRKILITNWVRYLSEISVAFLSIPSRLAISWLTSSTLSSSSEMSLHKVRRLKTQKKRFLLTQ